MSTNLINKFNRINYVLRLYNTELNHAVMKILDRVEHLSNKKLKEMIESKEYLGKTLSPDTFYSHLKDMIADK